MLRITTLIGLCCVASFAQAADNGIYLGAGIGQSEYGLDNPLDAEPFDDKDTGYKLIAGWRLLDSFGLEASCQDHGDATVPSGIAWTSPVNRRLASSSINRLPKCPLSRSQSISAGEKRRVSR